MINPYPDMYDPDLTSTQFMDAVAIIANPEITWPMPYQQHVQAFFQEDMEMRERLNISVPVLEAPNPWHMPADIRAQADVYARFVAYTDHMRRLQPDVPCLHDP